MRARWWTFVILAACGPQQRYSYQEPRKPERPLPPVSAQVVSLEHAERSGLPRQVASVPFEGEADGTKLVTQFLASADAAGARYVADLAIFLQTTRDGRAVECRSDIEPEMLTETRVRPARFEQVPVTRPVQRLVTEQQHRCRPTTKLESRPYTAYEQRCGSVSKPVQRTRTTYRSQYDSFSKSYRSVPQTETYTSYESHYECKSQPVTRTRMESVSSQTCGYESVTRMVTRHEFQFESRYIPPQLDRITRQRLSEREPVCYVADTAEGPPSAARRNRIEGSLFTPPR